VLTNVGDMYSSKKCILLHNQVMDMIENLVCHRQSHYASTANRSFQKWFLIRLSAVAAIKQCSHCDSA